MLILELIYCAICCWSFISLSSRSKSRPNPRQVTSSRTSSNSNDADGQGAVYDSLCSIASDSILGLRSVVLDHHLYDNMCDRWFRQPSKPQPFINLEIATHREDYQSLGFTLTSRPSKCIVSGMADTGCQSCLCGLPVMNKLGISEKNLIPVTMRMHAANKAPIKILGAAIIRLSGRAKSGKRVETRQILYVTDNADKLFISREACISWV